MNNKSKQSITIPAEVLGLSDVEVESVTTDLRARQITIRVVSTKDEILWALGVFALNCIISRHGWIEPFETSQVQH
ncbi:hypothetical protein [Legionella feeleii]|uniref:Uncharacterized protein n=1 Tax=Legionella feeleii TaxID=453 RepID=A0A2X1R5E1_9GAMM|nr:hypothetical protein [Legionella feeleii]SPX61980.1 Uncharacterised protein [Legionella feeleii]